MKNTIKKTKEKLQSFFIKPIIDLGQIKKLEKKSIFIYTPFIVNKSFVTKLNKLNKEIILK